MKQLVLTDQHIGGHHEMRTKICVTEEVVAIGDIVDLRNCLWKSESDFLIKIVKIQMKKFKGYAMGNHEYVSKGWWFWKKPVFGTNPELFYHIEEGDRGKCLFIHGHQFKSTFKETVRRMKRDTAGVNIISWIINFFKRIQRKELYPKQPKEVEHVDEGISLNRITKAIKLMEKHDCVTIVYGHTHTEKYKEVKWVVLRGDQYIKYTIINLPRGLHEVDI